MEGIIVQHYVSDFRVETSRGEDDQIDYRICDLKRVSERHPDVCKLPFTLKVLLENGLRNCASGESDRYITAFLTSYFSGNFSEKPFVTRFQPMRVLMQDFTGVPAVVDLAAMRDAVHEKGGNASKINPKVPVDLVIDHSVTVDEYGSAQAYEKNVTNEFRRNNERYTFLKWAQQSLDNFRVVPPGTGICHQVNLEYLGTVVHQYECDKRQWLAPDTLVGTDSHTTMINALGIVGWGVGGIEAEAAMLNQPLPMEIPRVLGVRLMGGLRPGVTATDLVLTLTEMLRAKGVVGMFVEFHGDGLDTLSLEDRATVANMCPEFGSTVACFPIDQQTIDYLAFTGRTQEHCTLVRSYAQHQGLWRTRETATYSEIVEFDLNTVTTCLAGPKRPQDRVRIEDIPQSVESSNADVPKAVAQILLDDQSVTLTHGDVVMAAITSCTNTSNPAALIAAGLMAQKANSMGLRAKLWVKTSFAPGSQVVTDYMEHSGLQKHLDALGFNLVGYGCTTCIGNSGPLRDEVARAIDTHDLSVCSVLSGNRNFEGRVHPQTKLNYLGSPALVVAYALLGTMNKDVTAEALGTDNAGNTIYLKDIWPTSDEIRNIMGKSVNKEMFASRYAHVFDGTDEWQKLKTLPTDLYAWDSKSTYVQRPPYFDTKYQMKPENIANARVLVMLGDSTTTDHISPAGSIANDSPAASYLTRNNVPSEDFNSYGSRRGNHEVMMRGTFANIRMQNELTPGKKGSWTHFYPTDEEMNIFEASKRYRDLGVPTVVIAGREYGTGSSRDWAAKGTQLLGARAVIAESFERIHRTNLVGMGVLPLTFTNGETRKSLNIDGSETWNIIWPEEGKTRLHIPATILRSDGALETIHLQAEIYTAQEQAYLRHGGIMPFVVNSTLGLAPSVATPT